MPNPDDIHDDTVLELMRLGFRTMHFPKDLWPPTLATAAGADLFICVAVKGFSRNNNPKTELVPLMKTDVTKLDWEWVKQRIRYHEERKHPPAYGKSR